MIICVNKADYRSIAYSPDGLVWDLLAVEVPDDFSPGNKTYNPDTGEWFTDPIPARDYASEANAERQRLIELYRTTIANWELDLRLGDISDEDLAKLKAWRNWRKAVEAVDTSVASEEAQVEWPAQLGVDVGSTDPEP